MSTPSTKSGERVSSFLLYLTRVLRNSTNGSSRNGMPEYSHTYATHSKEATPDDFLVLTKPGVLLLVVYTAAIGLVLAPGTQHPILSLISILAIALGSAGAGAFNMWYDRDIDIVMNRTKNRPIPQNKIAPGDALGFALILSITSVVLLFMATNTVAGIKQSTVNPPYARRYQRLLNSFDSAYPGNFEWYE